MKRITRPLLKLLGGFVMLAGILITIVYFNQERLVFHPTILDKNFHFEFKSPLVEKSLTIANGDEIDYLHFLPQSRLGNILFFHGNGGSLRGAGEAADEIAQKTGWSVWMMDYPGFGKSRDPLVKNERPLLDLGRRFVGLIQKESPDLPLLFYGRSLGTGIASMVAQGYPGLPLILETPYVSLAKIGHQMYPMLPEFFSRFDLDTARSLRAMLDRRVLILGAEKDRTIPIEHARELSRISIHYHYVEFPGADHNELHHYPQYWTELAHFLKDSQNVDRFTPRSATKKLY